MKPSLRAPSSIRPIRRFLPAAILVAGMFPVVAVPAGTPHDANVAPAAYAELLRRHLVPAETAGGGEETRFDYGGLRARPDQAGLRRDLRAAFTSVDPEALDPRARLAWAINTYNFFVIDVVTENLVSGKGDTLGSIADIGEGSFRVFDEPRVAIGGTRWSLDAFERHFLFLDMDRETGPLPEGLDPRIHFAIVCAARGCPPLLPEPYLAADLDARLDRAVRATLGSPRHFRFDGTTAHLSSLFLWYEADFGGFEGVVDFVRAHAPGETAKALAAEGVRFRPDIEWDWSLNRP